MKTPKTQRRTRPVPERSAPDRSWKAKAANGAPNAKANGASSDAGGGSAERPAGAEGGRSSAYRVLNDAYRLVDEYLRQGQKMAESIWLPLAGGGASGLPMVGAPERLMRAVGDMTLAWAEVAQQWTNAEGAPSREATGSAGPFTSAGRAASDSRAATSASATRAPSGQPHLSVSVRSKGRVEVSLALAEVNDVSRLCVTELRAFTGMAPPIVEVSLLVAEDASARLLVVVPDDQPAGTYNGLVLEAANQKPRGTLSVVVFPAKG